MKCNCWAFFTSVYDNFRANWKLELNKEDELKLNVAMTKSSKLQTTTTCSL